MPNNFSAFFQDLSNSLPKGQGSLLPGKDPPRGLVIHHEPEHESSWEIARAHVKTYVSIGYHFVIEPSGVIYMTLSPEHRGHHAHYRRGDDIRKFPNRDPQFYDDWYLGVAFCGHDPLEKQVESLVQLTAAFLQTNPKFDIRGAKELPGKEHVLCPGNGFSLEYIRAEARRRLEDKGPDVSWMKEYVSPKDAAVSIKTVLDDREALLRATQVALRESTQILRSQLNVLADLDLSIGRALGKE